MDQALFDRIQNVKHDSFFRMRSGGGFDHIVNAPYIGGPLSSAYEKLPEFDQAVLEVGRLGLHEVHAICWGIDVSTDGVERISEIPLLTRDGAITVRHMAGGRC